MQDNAIAQNGTNSTVALDEVFGQWVIMSRTAVVTTTWFKSLWILHVGYAERRTTVEESTLFVGTLRTCSVSWIRSLCILSFPISRSLTLKVPLKCSKEYC